MRAAPWLPSFLITLGLCCALWWPVPVHPNTWHALTPFADSHVWVFDWLFRGYPFPPDTTDELGFPLERSVRFIGWVPGLVAAGLRPFFGPLGAANMVQLLSLPASAMVAGVLIRRWTQVSASAAAGLGAVWALSPTLLATFGAGEISNTQAWVIPAALLAWEGAAERRPWSLVGLGVAAFAAAFTSPYYALCLPLLGLGLTLGRGRGALGALPALGVLGLGLLPAWFYYRERGGAESVFEPARASVAATEKLPFPSPVAQLDELFWGTAQGPGSLWEPSHVAHLGMPLLMAVGAALVFRFGMRGPGLARGLLLFLGGVVLALGPALAIGGEWYRVDGARLMLPAALLEAVGYPTRVGGLYFRFSVLAGLGLVLALGSLLQKHPRAGLLATSLALAQALGSLADTGPFWPRPAEQVQGLEWLEQIRPEKLRSRGGDDHWAVLELPPQGVGDAWFGQQAMLRAVFHGRPTTALPRDVKGKRNPVQRQLDEALASPDPREALRKLGYGFVILPVALAEHWDDSALRAGLGEPTRIDGLWAWDLR